MPLAGCAATPTDRRIGREISASEALNLMEADVCYRVPARDEAV